MNFEETKRWYDGYHFSGAEPSYSPRSVVLPAPTPAPTGCDADCQNAIRAYLPVGTTGVNIKAGGQTVGQGTVRRSEYGLVVLVGSDNKNPTFVSTCKAEIITK